MPLQHPTFPVLFISATTLLCFQLTLAVNKLHALYRALHPVAGVTHQVLLLLALLAGAISESGQLLAVCLVEGLLALVGSWLISSGAADWRLAQIHARAPWKG